MRFARANNPPKRQPERATPWHRMLKDAKDDDDEDSSEATASSTPSDLAPKRKSVEPDEDEVKGTANAKISKVEGATDVTTGSQKATNEKAQNAVKKGVANFEPEDVSDDEAGDDDEGSEDEDDDDEAEDGEDDADDGGGDSEGDEEDDDDEDAKAKKNSPKLPAKGKGSEKFATGTVCFKCREGGHLMRDCPKMKSDEDANMCYKCGSTEHFASKCKIRSKESMPFAKCFICNQMGHIARSCSQNKNGAYPNGGKCALCDSNKHLKSECPVNAKNKQKVMVVKRGVNQNKSADMDDNFDVGVSDNSKRSQSTKSAKTVKF